MNKYLAALLFVDKQVPFYLNFYFTADKICEQTIHNLKCDASNYISEKTNMIFTADCCHLTNIIKLDE